MPSLATLVQQGKIDPVVGALALRYANDPKLAVEVVTGAAEYPSPDGESAAALSIRAAERADELEHLRRCRLSLNGKLITRLMVDELRAAELALLHVAEDEADEARDHRWQDDTRPYVPAVQYR